MVIVFYRIEAPGQPVAYGEYRDEMECRMVVRMSLLVKDMTTVKVTPLYDDFFAGLTIDDVLAKYLDNTATSY